MFMKKKNIFSQIINKEIKSNIIFQDIDVTAFNDINPLVPIHILIVPNVYISGMDKLSKDNIYILGKMLFVSSIIAKKKKISSNGYRVIVNCNKHGGQKIDYLHLHLLGGCDLGKMINLSN